MSISLEETCEKRKESITGSATPKGFDWEGDRGYVGVLKELLISACAQVSVCMCVRMMVDLEKHTEGLKTVLPWRIASIRLLGRD